MYGSCTYWLPYAMCGNKSFIIILCIRNKASNFSLACMFLYFQSTHPLENQRKWRDFYAYDNQHCIILCLDLPSTFPCCLYPMFLGHPLNRFMFLERMPTVWGQVLFYSMVHSRKLADVPRITDQEKCYERCWGFEFTPDQILATNKHCRVYCWP